MMPQMWALMVWLAKKAPRLLSLVQSLDVGDGTCQCMTRVAYYC